MATRSRSLGYALDADRIVLEASGEEYELDPEFPLADIDLAQSLKNQARVGEKVNEATVEKYRIARLNGANFPPGIAHLSRHSRGIVDSGIHRVLSAQAAGLETIPMYVVTSLEGKDVLDPAAVWLQITSNVLMGYATDERERIHQALRMLDTTEMPLKEVAKAMLVEEDKLRKAHDAARAFKRLEDLKVNTEGIPKTAIGRLANIRSDRVVKAAARVVPLMESKTAETSEMVKAVNQGRTEREQLRVVRDWEQMLANRPAVKPTAKRGRPRKGAATIPNAVNRFSRALDEILRTESSEFDAEMIAEYREHLAERVRQVHEHLSVIEAAL